MVTQPKEPGNLKRHIGSFPRARSATPRAPRSSPAARDMAWPEVGSPGAVRLSFRGSAKSRKMQAAHQTCAVLAVDDPGDPTSNFRHANWPSLSQQSLLKKA